MVKRTTDKSSHNLCESSARQWTNVH